MATLTRKSSAKAHKPFANYSHVVTAQGANKLVFCAGQVAADPAGKVLPPDDFGAQTKMVMANLVLALEEGGASLKDVVKVTIYMQSARRAASPHDSPGVFWQRSASQHALCAARTCESEFPAGNRSHRGGVSGLPKKGPRRRDALGLNSHAIWGAPGDSRGHLINSTDEDLFLPGFLKLLEFYSAAGCGSLESGRV
jgi:enamine deaminase RidA (YjgF/YER057c/UK114 family)